MTEEDQSLEEEELRWSAFMRAAQGGDSGAFEMLLNEILPKIRSQVYGRLGGREHAEDVVQNVLLSIHRSRNTYHPSRPFKPWMNAVTRNAVIDAMRARRHEWRLQTFEEYDHPADSQSAPVESEAISRELEDALLQLSEGQREAVRLLHIEDMSVREAAARSGATISAFKVRAHRGRIRLREILMGRKS